MLAKKKKISAFSVHILTTKQKSGRPLLSELDSTVECEPDKFKQ